MIRLGKWQDVLADVETCDAVICDPPYGARAHNADGARADGLAPTYAHWMPTEVTEFLASWTPRCTGWIVALTCSDLAPVFRDSFFAHGWYGFAPIPCVIRGMSVRLAGDGPSSWAVYAVAGRPRTRAMAMWGTLDGAYVGPAQRGAGGGRGKPRWLMDGLVRDYSRAGDLVVDPFAGWGSTAISALGLDRRFLGAEMDADARDEALRRLGRGQQRDLFASGAA